MKTPDCPNCVHRSKIPGDAHSQCKYPGNKDDIFAMFGLPAIENLKNAIKLNIKADEHAIEKGWFNWPANFDPTWLRNCDGFEEKEKGKTDNKQRC